MNSAIDTFEQHHIDFLQQRRNGFDDLYIHLSQLIGESFDAIAAGRNVRSARITRHDADARYITRGLWVVEEFGERRHMRSVQTDHSGAKWRLIRRRSAN